MEPESVGRVPSISSAYGTGEAHRSPRLKFSAPTSPFIVLPNMDPSAQRAGQYGNPLIPTSGTYSATRPMTTPMSGARGAGFAPAAHWHGTNANANAMPTTYMPQPVTVPGSNQQRVMQAVQRSAAPPAAPAGARPLPEHNGRPTPASKEADSWGWLLKQNRRGGWDSRWFELHGSTLTYYVKKDEAVANRVVPLQGSRLNVDKISSAGSRYSWEVIAPQCKFAKRYVFAADSASTRDLWMAAMSAASTKPPTTPVHGRVKLVALVNGKSGGKQGEALIRDISKHLGEDNVFDITRKGAGGPSGALKAFAGPNAPDAQETRFVVCGGDGTVGWSLEDLDKCKKDGSVQSDQTFAVLPLGTGNDMARTLKCGGGYHGERLVPILKSAAMSNTTALDRWRVTMQVSGPDGKALPPQSKLMCNYFSVGYDAKIAHKFHVMRETHRHLFTSRLVNKAWYALFGAQQLGNMLDVSQLVKLTVDGVEVELPGNLKAVTVINIPSYSGGANLWGAAPTEVPFRKPRTDDGMLEVVGMCGPVHSLMTMTGVGRAYRLAQGKQVEMSLRQPAPGSPLQKKLAKNGIHCQVDGEPYLVDHAGFHSDHEYKPTDPPPGSGIDFTVKIVHHAVAHLVQNDAIKVGCMCMGSVKMPGE